MNIITALNNPNINKKLKQEKDFNIIGNDIQYQEGILEMLQQNNKIELIIISELLPGEIEFKELINKIKNINKQIEIIIILNNKNEELNNYLISKGIFNIFLNNEITIEELIKIINDKNKIKKEIEINEEIKKLKKIILEKENKKNKINLKIINNKKIINIKNKINKKIIKYLFKLFKNKNLINKLFKNKNKKNNFNKKIISVIGNFGIGKSSFCTIFAKLIKNKKILIIDFDILNSSINSIFNVQIYPKKAPEKNTNINVKKRIIKISKNINLLCATRILVDDNYKMVKENFVNELDELKYKYDVIIIDNSSECFFEYTKQILNKSDIILFLTEPNLIELKKSKNLLNIYINKWKIKKEKINIIFNKINKFSIYDEILKILFSEFNILGKIKLNINYNLIINKNLKNINKKIKNDYLKIIKELKI